MPSPVPVQSAEGSNSSDGRSSPVLGAHGCGTVSTAPPGSTSPPTKATAQGGISSYSPASTELFLKCPMLWVQTQRGVQPRVEPEWTPNRLIGTAVATGLSAAYRQYDYIGSPLTTLPFALPVAYTALEAGWVEQDTWNLPALQKLVERGIRLAIEGPQLEGMQAVVLTEQDVYGRRPDVVFRRHGGGLVLDENKVTLSLDARYQEARLAEYDHAWQIRDYAYHVSLYLAEPITETRYQLLVLGPRKQVVLHKVALTAEALTQWYQSAQAVWAAMAAVEAGEPPWQNLTACTNKGLHFGRRCWLHDFCHLCEGDAGRAESLYVIPPSQEGRHAL